MATKQFLTKAEAAEFLSIGMTTLGELLRTGEIPHLRIRGAVRIRATALDSYLEGAEVRGHRSRRGGPGRPKTQVPPVQTESRKQS